MAGMVRSGDEEGAILIPCYGPILHPVIQMFVVLVIVFITALMSYRRDLHTRRAWLFEIALVVSSYLLWLVAVLLAWIFIVNYTLGSWELKIQTACTVNSIILLGLALLLVVIGWWRGRKAGQMAFSNQSAMQVVRSGEMARKVLKLVFYYWYCEHHWSQRRWPGW